MRLRPRLPLVAAVFAAVAVTAAPASADPLGGTGENTQAIAHLDIGDGQKNEIELAGNYAYVSWDGGVTIVNIADPYNPKIEGVWDCPGGWGDIDLSPDAKVAVVAESHGGYCPGSGSAATLIDISDKKHPKTLGAIDLDDQIEYTHTVTLDNKTLYLNPQVWAGYPQTTQHVAVYDVSDPAKPARKGFIEFTPGVQAAAHDTYVDHRPDNKTLMYAASMHTTDVFNIDNPVAAVLMQRVVRPDMTLSHQAEPNFDRSMLIVDDESFVDVGAPVGAVCGHVGTGPASFDVGSVHFFGLDGDGTMTANGLLKLGSWNLPFHQTPGTCTGHVFWTAPNENRLTQAWYTEGARILDFSDPANVKQLGWFKADKPTQYWSAKPHRGFIFATDMDRGLDVIKYTGEGGTRWPATAPPAEIQRAGKQGVPYVPLPGSDQLGFKKDKRSLGRFSFNVRLGSVKGKKLTITFTTSKGKAVKRLRFSGKRSIRVSGIAVAGRYRWTIRSGSRTLKRGSVRVKKTKGATLSPKAKMDANVR
jgi:hypothetical protein